MTDFNFLLGAKPVDVPNPLSFVTQGASLADLMTRVQAGQLALTTANQAAGYAGPLAQAYANNQDPMQVLANLAPSLPYGYAKALQDVKTAGLTEAQRQEALGKGVQARTEAYTKSVQLAGNMASAIATQPIDKPLTPMQTQLFAAQMQQAAAIGGMDPQTLGLPPPDAPEAAWRDYARATTPVSVTPEQNANIDKAFADANLARVNAGLAPFKTQAELMQARAAASQAATAANKQAFGEAKFIENPLDGSGYVFTPQTANAPQLLMPVFGPGGVPIQVAPTAGQKTIFGAMGKDIEASQGAIAEGYRTIQLAKQLKAITPESMSNPLVASEAGRAFYSLAYPFLTDAQRQQWQGAKTSEVFSQQMLGALIHSMAAGGRGSQYLAMQAQLGKPGLTNPPEIRDAMADAMVQDAVNMITLNKDKLGYIQGPNGAKDPALKNWVPPPTTFTAPAPVAGTAPKLSAGEIGKRDATSGQIPVGKPDGTVGWASNMRQAEIAAERIRNAAAVPAGPPSSLAPLGTPPEGGNTFRTP